MFELELPAALVPMTMWPPPRTYCEESAPARAWRRPRRWPRFLRWRRWRRSRLRDPAPAWCISWSAMLRTFFLSLPLGCRRRGAAQGEHQGEDGDDHRRRRPMAEELPRFRTPFGDCPRAAAILPRTISVQRLRRPRQFPLVRPHTRSAAVGGQGQAPSSAYIRLQVTPKEVRDVEVDPGWTRRGTRSWRAGPRMT